MSGRLRSHATSVRNHCASAADAKSGSGRCVLALSFKVAPLANEPTPSSNGRLPLCQLPTLLVGGEVQIFWVGGRSRGVVKFPRCVVQREEIINHTCTTPTLVIMRSSIDSSTHNVQPSGQHGHFSMTKLMAAALCRSVLVSDFPSFLNAFGVLTRMRSDTVRASSRTIDFLPLPRRNLMGSNVQLFLSLLLALTEMGIGRRGGERLKRITLFCGP